jgi:hypothetical protein
MAYTPKFQAGDRFQEWSFLFEKVPPAGPLRLGTVIRLRDDRWERENCHPQGRFHYTVKFDDGSFESNQSEMDMKPLTM